MSMRSLFDLTKGPPEPSGESDREIIMQRVQKAVGPLEGRALMPVYDYKMVIQDAVVAGRDWEELLAERMARVNSRMLADPASVVAYLDSQGWRHGYCDPLLWRTFRFHFPPTFEVELDFDTQRVDDYTFGLTTAAGAIAESGTIILNDEMTSRRIGALAPWCHVAVILREDIVLDVPTAVRRFGLDRNIIWVTGPSKTADVEGILIEGVHGPGVQLAIVLDKRL